MSSPKVSGTGSAYSAWAAIQPTPASPPRGHVCWMPGRGSTARLDRSDVLIGAMNHPAREVLQEIEWIAALGLGFIDLTLEPPKAASWRVDPPAIRAALDRHRLAVVGHTAF